ncbi:2-methoxy-6-polyprenyl-1,4-benzoquinol methylase, mitochondrial [Streptomyces griseus]
MYTHGHHESVLRSHRWRTAANSAAYLLGELGPGLTVLDVGCGPGTITADLAALVAPGRVTAVDTSTGILGQAAAVASERGLENVEFAVADVHALDFPDDSFDVVARPPGAPARGRLLHRAARQRLRQPRARLLGGGGPVAAVHGGRVGGQRAVGLQPAEGGARLQRHVLQLGAGETGLDLRVATAPGPVQPLLPAAAALPVAPAEQFAAAQQVGGGLGEPVAVRVERGDPPAGVLGQLVEVVGGVRGTQRVGVVEAVRLRDADPGEGVVVAEVPGLVGRDQHPGVRGLRHGDVGPPVDRCGLLVRVAYPYADVQEVGVVGEPEVHLEGQVAQPLPLPEADHRAAVGCGHERGVQRRAGQGGVAGGADVPLDPAGEPGPVEGEGGGLEDRVAVEEFAAGGLVVQGVDPAAESGQHGDPQPPVLDDDGVDAGGGALTPVPVEQPGGQDGAQRPVAQLPGHVAGQARPFAGVEGGRRGGRAEWWERVLRSERCCGQVQYGTSYGRGQGALVPSRWAAAGPGAPGDHGTRRWPRGPEPRRPDFARPGPPVTPYGREIGVVDGDVEADAAGRVRAGGGRRRRGCRRRA